MIPSTYAVYKRPDGRCWTIHSLGNVDERDVATHYQVSDRRRSVWLMCEEHARYWVAFNSGDHMVAITDVGSSDSEAEMW